MSDRNDDNTESQFKTTTVQPWDVLIVYSGPREFFHQGNRALRQIVNEYREDFFSWQNLDKTKTVRQIADKVKSTGGRFLDHPRGDTNCWVIVPDCYAQDRAIIKELLVAQALHRKLHCGISPSSWFHGTEFDIIKRELPFQLQIGLSDIYPMMRRVDAMELKQKQILQYYTMSQMCMGRTAMHISDKCAQLKRTNNDIAHDACLQFDHDTLDLANPETNGCMPIELLDEVDELSQSNQNVHCIVPENGEMNSFLYDIPDDANDTNGLMRNEVLDDASMSFRSSDIQLDDKSITSLINELDGNGTLEKNKNRDTRPDPDRTMYELPNLVGIPLDINQNVHYSIPENGVCFKLRRLHTNLPGITGQYRNRRDGLFGTTKRRKRDRTVTNDYIDKKIIGFLKLQCRLPEIRFFVYAEANEWYEEIFGDTMYQAMQDDIMNKKYKDESPTNDETPAKKASRKKAPPEPKSDVIPTSAPSTGCMLSDLITSKRMLLNKMPRDLKVSLYEQMIWDVSHALSSRNLNDEKTKEEMYTWLYCTWHHFFENNSEQNMNILTVSSSESNDDGDSSGNGRSRPPDNHKKRKGNPKDDKDNEYDDDEYDPASNDCSGNAKRCADGTIYLDECNDIETSGYMEFCAKHFVNVEPHQYMIQVC